MLRLIERGRPPHLDHAADPKVVRLPPGAPTEVAHYTLLSRLPAGDEDECWRALPGRGPRVVHLLRRFPGCSLVAGAALPGAPLALHREQLGALLERGRWPRRRALAVETVYELGESAGVPYVVTQYIAGADLRAVSAALAQSGRSLSWALRLLLLIEGSEVLAAQHYAGYAHGALTAARLRLTPGAGPPLRLCRAYPLRRVDTQLIVADPDSPSAQLADRWALAAAVLALGSPEAAALTALAHSGDPDTQRVLWDQLSQRVHPLYEHALATYLDGSAAELPLPEALADVLAKGEVEQLWQAVSALC